MAAASPALPRDAAWLFGRNVDLLIGAGLGYLITLPLLLAAGARGISEWPVAIVAAISFFISAPHYGATLLRVYEQRADRQRYAFFAVHLTAFLAAAFVAGVYSVWIGSLLVTLYITTSPWHVGGQNYGVALMFLRRRGVAIPPRAKRLFYASFVLAFVLTVLSTHVTDSNVVYAAGAATGGNEYTVLRLGLPASWVVPIASAVLAAYLLSVVASLALLARTATAADLAPVVSVILAQSLWFVVPTVFFFTHSDSASLLPFAAIWISACHSAQYLWVTSYYAKRADPSTRTGPYLLRTLLAGSFITIVPGLLFIPSFTGGVSWHAGLGILLFAVVNLHHFALDGAVWKLRDGQVARALLRTAASEAGASPPRERVGRLWRLVWAGGALALGLACYEHLEREVSLSGVTVRDLGRAQAALDRLAWVGRDGAGDRVQLGNAYVRLGDLALAEAQFRRSLELGPTADAWIGIAEVSAAAGEWEPAIAAYRSAQRLARGDASPHVGFAKLLERLERAEAASAAGGDASAAQRAVAHRREAIAAFEQVLVLQPRYAAAYHRLAQAYERDGRPEAALAVLERALGTVRAGDRPAIVNEIGRLRARAAPASAS